MPQNDKFKEHTEYLRKYKSQNESFLFKCHLSQTPLTWRSLEVASGWKLLLYLHQHTRDGAITEAGTRAGGSLGAVCFREMMRGCDLKRTLNVLRRLIFSFG